MHTEAQLFVAFNSKVSKDGVKLGAILKRKSSTNPSELSWYVTTFNFFFISVEELNKVTLFLQLLWSNYQNLQL